MRQFIRMGLSAVLLAILIPVLMLTITKHSTANSETIELSQTEDSSEIDTVPLQAVHVEMTEEIPAYYDDEQRIGLMMESGFRILPLSEYLVGVLMGELPPSFENETIMAQAIAARTFALRQIENGKHDGYVCGEAGCCQAWLSPENAKSLLGDAYDAWLLRVESAIRETDGRVITFDDELIEVCYFSCSGGKTEAALEVWGGDVPYLVSVDSPGEEEAPRYTATVEWPAHMLREALCTAFPELRLSGEPEEWLEEVTYSAGGGVLTLLIGGQAISGTSLRQTLGLNSTRFSVTLQDNVFVFETQGYGHRVGMSQYGANAMAQDGASYAEILAHYYPGTELCCVSLQ